MATIKSYTDLEQSKKLAEILPLKSADMSYSFDFDSGTYKISTASYKSWVVPKYARPDNGFGQVIPCWSLAALLDILPTIDDEFEPQLHRSSDKYLCTYEGKEDSSGLWKVANNPVDACYEMILKLNEINLL